MSQNCCVYFHLLNNVIVYIGSGSNRRLRSKFNKSKAHLEVWEDLEFIVHAENLTKDESLDLEEKLIAEHWESGNLFNLKRTVDRVRYISYSKISNYIYLDESSPTFIRWKFKSIKTSVKDGVAGTLKSKGYSQVKIDKVYYLLHRLIYCLVSKEDLLPTLVVDHIDRNPLNNQPINLRAITQSENSRNKRHKASNTGIQGISEDYKGLRFDVGYNESLKKIHKTFSYNPNGRSYNLNLYPTRELALSAAIRCRDEMVLKGKIILT